MLFKSQEKDSKPQLAQSEREAIVDLLHLCLYADAHISLKEGEFISEVVEVIGWDQNLSFSAYEARSIAAARAAKTDDSQKKEFIEFASSRLKAPASRSLALQLCADLFSADATQDREAALLAQLRALLR